MTRRSWSFLAASVALALTFAAAYPLWRAKADHAFLEECALRQRDLAAKPGTTQSLVVDHVWACARERHLDAFFERRDIKVSLESHVVRVLVSYDRPVRILGFSCAMHFDIGEPRSYQ